MFVAEGSAQQNLFGQYSTYGANQVEASAYPAPHAVPPHVGGSLYTYQPLMPHEMMYTHARNYYHLTGGPERYYADPYGSHWYRGGSSINVTKVRWQSGANSFSPLPFSAWPLAPLHYKWSKHRYMSGGHHFGHGGGGCSTGNCGGISYDAGFDTSYAPAQGCSGGCAQAPTPTVRK